MLIANGGIWGGSDFFGGIWVSGAGCRVLGLAEDFEFQR